MRIINWDKRKPVFRPSDSDLNKEDREVLQTANPANQARKPQEFLFYDERLDGSCIYCGAPDGSDEHAPSKVFLDKPYPPNLPVVAACEECNTSFSKDESYLAAVLECVICGSTEPQSLQRPVIRKMLERSPALCSQIRAAMTVSEEGIVTHPDLGRVQRVLLKLARGHIKYELAESISGEDFQVWSAPLALLSEEQRYDFENPPTGGIAAWPEIGSRAFTELIVGVDGETGPFWWGVQEGRYRYWVDPGGPFEVRMVISEYLAAIVRFCDKSENGGYIQKP